MREIKFRVWCKHRKEMYEEYFGVDIEQPNIVEFGNEDKVCWSTREEIVLMQYTGLIDKNGKEIYEGDIVNYFKDELAEIKLKKGCFAIESENYIDYFHEILGEIEVVGNIYENKELLA